jgi:hypothetical protein
MVRHTAANMNRYEVGADGMSAYKRIKGKDFKMDVPKFGECIWFLKPKSKGRDKSRYRWEKGIWLGVRDESGEHIVGNRDGVVKVRAIRRRGSQEDRWNWEEFQEMKGLPWEPVPGRPGIEIKARIEDGMEAREVPVPTAILSSLGTPPSSTDPLAILFS